MFGHLPPSAITKSRNVPQDKTHLCPLMVQSARMCPSDPPSAGTKRTVCINIITVLFFCTLAIVLSPFRPWHEDYEWWCWLCWRWLDLNDGQFSERCDVDDSFFNSDAMPIIFGKSLTSPSSQLFSLTIGNDYFSIIITVRWSRNWSGLRQPSGPPHRLFGPTVEILFKLNLVI